MLIQTYRNFTLIIINDGSTELEVNSILDSYLDNKDIVIVKHERNKGVAAALNTGLDIVR